jgi:hypothetical protein
VGKYLKLGDNILVDEKDIEELKTAAGLLEHPSIWIRLINLLGYPIERAVKRLPGSLSRIIQRATGGFLGRALSVALSTMHPRDQEGPLKWRDRAFVVLTGAAGGFFGLPGILLELPVSTTAMLRSIADVARSEGQDLSSPEVQLACLEVFALGSVSAGDNAAETGYYAIRTAMAKVLSEAAEFIAQRGIVGEGAPAVVKMLARFASRFGVVLTDKMAAEIVPVLGALGGATINLIFITHFQSMAHGHFIIRRLEKKYGAEAVRIDYEKMTSKQKLLAQCISPS